MTSPHPKLAAILALLATLVGDAQAVLAGTPVNWVATIAAISLCYGLFRSRQNNVTSEQAGAK